jgi:hypothetical protein
MHYNTLHRALTFLRPRRFSLCSRSLCRLLPSVGSTVPKASFMLRKRAKARTAEDYCELTAHTKEPTNAIKITRLTPGP